MDASAAKTHTQKERKMSVGMHLLERKTTTRQHITFFSMQMLVKKKKIVENHKPNVNFYCKLQLLLPLHVIHAFYVVVVVLSPVFISALHHIYLYWQSTPRNSILMYYYKINSGQCMHFTRQKHDTAM